MKNVIPTIEFNRMNIFLKIILWKIRVILIWRKNFLQSSLFDSVFFKVIYEKAAKDKKKLEKQTLPHIGKPAYINSEHVD